MATPNKTDEVLAAILTNGLETAEKTGQFLKEQLPDVVQQLLMWNIANCIMWISVVLIYYIVYSVGWVKFTKKAEASDMYSSSRDWAYTFKLVGGVIGVLIATPILMMYLSELLKLLIAPKVWLLEYAANIIRSA